MVSGLRTWYIIQKKKLKRKRKRHELCEARTHAIKSKIGHRDHLTILPKIHILIFRGARATHRTQPQEREREAVMTDDGSQPPIEQLATAVHPWTGHTLVVRPAAACAARRGCNVVGVLCMLSDVWISGMHFGEETQKISEILIQLR